MSKPLVALWNATAKACDNKFLSSVWYPAIFVSLTIAVLLALGVR
jgi:hypothetical protein